MDTCFYKHVCDGHMFLANFLLLTSLFTPKFSDTHLIPWHWLCFSKHFIKTWHTYPFCTHADQNICSIQSVGALYTFIDEHVYHWHHCLHQYCEKKSLKTIQFYVTGCVLVNALKNDILPFLYKFWQNYLPNNLLRHCTHLLTNICLMDTCFDKHVFDGHMFLAIFLSLTSLFTPKFSDTHLIPWHWLYFSKHFIKTWHTYPFCTNADQNICSIQSFEALYTFIDKHVYHWHHCLHQYCEKKSLKTIQFYVTGCVLVNALKNDILPFLYKFWQNYLLNNLLRHCTHLLTNIVMFDGHNFFLLICITDIIVWHRTYLWTLSSHFICTTYNEVQEIFNITW